MEIQHRHGSHLFDVRAQSPPPGEWVIICRDVGFDPVTLKMPASATPNENEIVTAQTAAIGAVKSRLQKMIESL